MSVQMRVLSEPSFSDLFSRNAFLKRLKRPVQCREEANFASLSFEPVNQTFHTPQSVIVFQTRAKMEPPVMK